LSDTILQKYLKSINVTRKTLRRIYWVNVLGNFLFLWYASCKIFKLNSIFPSTLILFASIYCKKGFATKNLLDNFYSKMLFLNSKKIFQRKRTWKFPDISYFEDLRQTRSAKKIPKTVMKTRLKIKETSYTMVFAK
jgi:hypothetical protein